MLRCGKCGHRGKVAVSAKVLAPISSVVDGALRVSIVGLLESVSDVGAEIVGERFICLECMEFTTCKAPCANCGRDVEFENVNDLKRIASRMGLGAYFAPVCEDCLSSMGR